MGSGHICRIGSGAGSGTSHGHLRFGGARLGVDWFPLAGGFHVSVGIWVPNLTQVSARLNLEPGKTLTLEGTDYTTDSTNPFRGSGSSAINRVAPVLTVGWGNLLPRNYRQRFSFPIELGAAYVGSPTVKVSTAGDICTAQGLQSRRIGPRIQSKPEYSHRRYQSKSQGLCTLLPNPFGRNRLQVLDLKHSLKFCVQGSSASWQEHYRMKKRPP
jgi:hypothetical protein